MVIIPLKWICGLAIITLALPKEVASDCSKFFSRFSKWISRTVDNGESLRQVLNIRSTNPDLGVIVKLQIINGTSWLNLGGDVNSFGLVVGTPPASSSDLTLSAAMEMLAKENTLGILFEFHPPELRTRLDITNTMDQPLWTLQAIETFSQSDLRPNVLPALKWSQSRFGLDKVLGRVSAENLLLNFDFERTKDILTSFYSNGRRPITENSITYLKRKYLTVQRQHPNTFTELFLNNLLHLVEGDSKTSGASFLKDLQDLSVSYTTEDVKQLEDKLSLIPTHDCVLLQVRAGIFLQNESINNLVGIMNKYPDRMRIIVTSLDHDQVDVKALVTAIDAVGKTKLILDLPEALTEDMRLASHIPNHIEHLAKSSAHFTKVMMIPTYIFLLLFSYLVK